MEKVGLLKPLIAPQLEQDPGQGGLPGLSLCVKEDPPSLPQAALCSKGKGFAYLWGMALLFHHMIPYLLLACHYANIAAFPATERYAQGGRPHGRVVICRSGCVLACVTNMATAWDVYMSGQALCWVLYQH